MTDTKQFELPFETGIPRLLSVDEIYYNRGAELLKVLAEDTVTQCEPKQRHLLLFVRKPGDKPQLDRFLCGHDERERFVAPVPGGASSVRQAMDALQPAPVRQALANHKVSINKRYTRKNRAFRRQGELFFVPEPSLVVDDKLVLRDEPLRRGAGKPHMVEQLLRTGGETVYVSSEHPNGLLPGEYKRLLKTDPGAAHWGRATSARASRTGEASR